ncbi:aldehyde dehydrogenase family 16 member A1 isoform X1, partial [Silurus asotus]
RLGSALQGYSQCVCEVCDLCQTPGSATPLIRLAQYYTGWAQLRHTLLPEWTPRGVVAVVMSDDALFYSMWLKVLPALAVGNAVIVVPGVQMAPPTLLLAQLFMKAGLPAGVLNVVTGNESVGVRVAQRSLINYISYSGSTQYGELLVKQVAGRGVPVSLSLSVCSVCPFIIFESADVDSAVDGLMEVAFKNYTEWRWVGCVQESVYDTVMEKLKFRMFGMKCVHVRDECEKARVDAAVHEAEQQGAMLIQACPPPSSGCGYPPTVVCNIAPSCPLVVSPPPGPALPLLSFRSAAEGVALGQKVSRYTVLHLRKSEGQQVRRSEGQQVRSSACTQVRRSAGTQFCMYAGNCSPHGRAASIWTEDLTLALETAKSLCVGLVCVNTCSVTDPSFPQSGRRESGTCTDGGREGLFQFLSASVTPPLSQPISLDYSKFGTAASKFLVPEGSDLSSVSHSSHLLGGRVCKADSGCSRSVHAPGGAVLAHCPDGGRKDVRNAVEAALKVQPGWMKKSPASRALALYSLSNCLDKRKQDMAASVHRQTGVSIEEAVQEVELSISRLSDWAALCDKQNGHIPVLPQTGSSVSTPEALGVVGVVLPDTKPLLSMVSVLGATVSVGNAVIIVTSEKFPLPALDFIPVLQASEVPAGVVSVISGGKDQLTQALANHNEIQAVWYWGSAQGRQFLQHCSPLKRLWLHCEEEEDENGREFWTKPSFSMQEEMWRECVVWKSVWIPTA